MEGNKGAKCEKGEGLVFDLSFINPYLGIWVSAFSLQVLGSILISQLGNEIVSVLH